MRTIVSETLRGGPSPPPETDWAYDITKFSQKPPEQAYTDAKNYQAIVYQRVTPTLGQLKGCLASGFPFIFGFTVYESFESQEVANSGHLVLASVHAPSAPGAVQSLLSLGVHPHFLSSSLQGVIAQRLVRTLCPRCKAAFDLGETPGTFEEVRGWLDRQEGRKYFVRGELRHGDVVCADAEGLFVALKPGQR